MKLLCQASQIETCLFILHGSQFGYLQKLICQKRRRLTVMRKQTFTKLFRQCFLAEFAALSGIILFSVCLGLSLRSCVFFSRNTSARLLCQKGEHPALLQGQAGPGGSADFMFLERSQTFICTLSLNPLVQEIFSSGQLGESQVVASLKWVLAVLPANIHS